MILRSLKIAKKVPRAHVVSAFNIVPSEVLFGAYEARREVPAGRAWCTVVTTRVTKCVAAELIRGMGFDPVDAGPFRIARYT